MFKKNLIINLMLFLNGDRGLKILSALRSHNFRVIGIVWHGSNINPNEFLDFPNLQITKNNWADVKEFISELQPDVAIVAGFSYLLPSEILDSVKLGFWNLHAGKIPEYRGGSPLNWQLINGEREIGISVLKITNGIDDGPILGETTFQVQDSDSICDLHKKAITGFSELVPKLLVDINYTILNATPQDESRAIYWHQRSDEDGYLDPSTQSAEQIGRIIRAVTKPYPGAWFKINNEKIRVFKGKVSKKNYKGVPGKILKLPAQKAILITCLGSIELIELEKNGSIYEFNASINIDQS